MTTPLTLLHPPGGNPPLLPFLSVDLIASINDDGESLIAVNEVKFKDNPKYQHEKCRQVQVILADTSGSMAMGERMNVLKGFLLRAAETIRDGEILSIIPFNSASQTALFYPETVDGSKVEKIVYQMQVDNLVAGGGTMLSPAYEKIAELQRCGELPETLHSIMVYSDGGLSDFPASSIAFGQVNQCTHNKKFIAMCTDVDIDSVGVLLPEYDCIGSSVEMFDDAMQAIRYNTSVLMSEMSLEYCFVNADGMQTVNAVPGQAGGVWHENNTGSVFQVHCLPRNAGDCVLLFSRVCKCEGVLQITMSYMSMDVSYKFEPFMMEVKSSDSCDNQRAQDMWNGCKKVYEDDLQSLRMRQDAMTQGIQFDELQKMPVYRSVSESASQSCDFSSQVVEASDAAYQYTRCLSSGAVSLTVNDMVTNMDVNYSRRRIIPDKLAEIGRVTSQA